MPTDAQAQTPPMPVPTQAQAAAPHTAVSGLQWGDEGKGQIVDLLAEQHDFIVRYNGGANAGHTVEIGNDRYALHLLPSGILDSSKINVIANGVVLDPAVLLEEIDGLATRGVEVGQNLRISNRAHVVMPYHKTEDALLEAAMSRAQGQEKKIGTTGRGIGPCYADKATRATAVRMIDLCDADRFARKLEHIATIKNATLGALAQLADEPFAPINAAQLAEQYAGYMDILRPHVCDTAALLNDAMAGGRRILFEGANAMLLDVDHGTYPYVTSSSCSALGIYSGAGVRAGQVGRVIGIVKCYTSRVGGGPMPTELNDQTAEHIREVGREYGTTTGRPRRCGWLDLMAVKYTATLAGATEIACTGLSVLADIDQLNVCVGYRHNGQALEHFPADAEVLGQIEPVYQTLDGFAGPLSELRSFDELPDTARAYIRFVEQFVGVPVRHVCVGRKREQILTRAE